MGMAFLSFSLLLLAATAEGGLCGVFNKVMLSKTNKLQKMENLQSETWET